MAATSRWKPGTRPPRAVMLGRSSASRVAGSAAAVGPAPGMAAFILLLIAFFFVRLFVEAKPAFDQFGYFGFTFGSDWKSPRTSTARCRCSIGTLITSAIALLHRRPGGGRRRALRDRAVPAAAAPAARRSWSSSWPRCPRSSTACGASTSSIPKLRPAEQWFSDTFSFLPLVGGHVAGPELLHRRADPRDHDPPDRLRDLARGHPHGAAPITRRPRSRSARRAGR